MQRLYGIVQDGLRAVPYAQVSVYAAGTDTLATIYSPSGSRNPSATINNPMTADAMGWWVCAVPDGEYTVKWSTSVGPERTVEYVQARDFDSTGTALSTAIVGSSDAVQLRVRGWSVQTNNIFTAENFAGSPVLTANATGAAAPTFAATVGTITTLSATNATIGTANITSATLGSVTLGTPVPATSGGTGLNAVGAANTLMGANAAGNANEYKTLSGTANQVTVTHTVAGVTLSLPQSIATASAPTFAGASLTNTLVIDKASGKGIKVDTASPTYPWAFIPGQLAVDAAGTNAPTQAAFIGGSVRRWIFSAGDKADFEFSIPHDYAPGTDIYVRVCWAHNGTAISGNFVGTFAYTYAKGHNQAVFSAEKTVTATYTTVNIATTPRYQHRIEDVAMSSAGGSASLLDNALLEPDGIIGMNYTQTTIPTITGGATEPFVIMVNIMYQSTEVGTKQKAPPFYT